MVDRAVKHLAAALLFVAACSSSSTEPGGSPVPPTPPAPPTFKPTAFAVQVSGAGRPVIFIPGLASAGDVWDGTVAHLGGKVQTHVLTLAGFAGQPAVPGPFFAQVHDQIAQYIVANHLDHPIIVGHSLGGVMSLWLAETEPNLGGIVDVEGLPFLGAVMDPSATAASTTAAMKPMHDQMAAMTPAELAAQMKQFLASMITKPADLERVAAESGRSDPKAYADAFFEMMGKDLRPDLAKITAPVTIIAATEGGAPRAMMEAAWKAQVAPIKGLDLQFVDHAKHFVMLDQPEAFYALLDKALARK